MRGRIFISPIVVCRPSTGTTMLPVYPLRPNDGPHPGAWECCG